MTSPLQPPQGRASGSIGERLRRAREEHGLSLNELSLKTRIPVRHLETIEDGRGPELPGGFIGKSFVRQYAQAVGMDGEQALRDFVAQTGVDLEVPFEERKVSPYTPESIQKYHAKVWRSVGIAAGALLTVVLVIAYFVTRPRKEPPAPPAAATRPRPSYLEPEPAVPTPASEPQASPLGMSSQPLPASAGSTRSGGAPTGSVGSSSAATSAASTGIPAAASQQKRASGAKTNPSSTVPGATSIEPASSAPMPTAATATGSPSDTTVPQ